MTNKQPGEPTSEQLADLQANTNTAWVESGKMPEPAQPAAPKIEEIAAQGAVNTYKTHPKHTSQVKYAADLVAATATDAQPEIARITAKRNEAVNRIYAEELETAKNSTECKEQAIQDQPKWAIKVARLSTKAKFKTPVDDILLDQAHACVDKASHTTSEKKPTSKIKDRPFNEVLGTLDEYGLSPIHCYALLKGTPQSPSTKIDPLLKQLATEPEFQTPVKETLISAELDPEPPEVSIEDFTNLPSFINKVMLSKDRVSRFLKTRLSAQTLKSFKQLKNHSPLSQSSQTCLTNDINALIADPTFYKSPCFATDNLSDEAKKLIAQNPNGNDVNRLNRMLLDDTYPLEISSYCKKGMVYREAKLDKAKNYIDRTVGKIAMCLSKKKEEGKKEEGKKEGYVIIGLDSLNWHGLTAHELRTSFNARSAKAVPKRTSSPEPIFEPLNEPLPHTSLVSYYLPMAFIETKNTPRIKDLFNEAALEIHKKMLKYDPLIGTFGAFCAERLKCQAVDYHYKSVDFPTARLKAINQLKEAREEAAFKVQGEPSIRDIYNILSNTIEDLTPAKFEQIRTDALPRVELNAPITAQEGEKVQVGDMFLDPDAQDPLEILTASDETKYGTKRIVQAAAKFCNKLEQRLIGLDLQGVDEQKIKRILGHKNVTTLRKRAVGKICKALKIPLRGSTNSKMKI